MLVKSWYARNDCNHDTQMLRGRQTLVKCGISWHPYQQFTNIEDQDMPQHAEICGFE